MIDYETCECPLILCGSTLFAIKLNSPLNLHIGEGYLGRAAKPLVIGDRGSMAKQQTLNPKKPRTSGNKRLNNTNTEQQLHKKQRHSPTNAYLKIFLT
jgi:hypothetical protein